MMAKDCVKCCRAPPALKLNVGTWRSRTGWEETNHKYMELSYGGNPKSAILDWEKYLDVSQGMVTSRDIMGFSMKLTIQLLR